MISTSAELAKARQREFELLANRVGWRNELRSYRRSDGAMQVLRLRRLRGRP